MSFHLRGKEGKNHQRGTPVLRPVRQERIRVRLNGEAYGMVAIVGLGCRIVVLAVRTNDVPLNNVGLDVGN